MLREVHWQPRGRRWFEDDYFDLIIWSYGVIVRAFQLCYDKRGTERVFTWSRMDGYGHYDVDTGDCCPPIKPAAALVSPTEPLAKEVVISEFRSRGGAVPKYFFDVVIRRLSEARSNAPEAQDPAES